ncbi:Zinc finger, CCCH-type [Parasponia andersonii]|uniref:Zinc finger, CCCH-type n=1 Tax=Parasponia andersonii TaxID=3476 RepID=A0A2P5DKE0_PARAD|nr:Zinc finger, CCCH-type [Parasponia andersonii]
MQKNLATMTSSSSISHGVVSSKSFFLDSDSPSTIAAAIDDHRRHLYHSILVQDHQEMVNRRSLCLNRLRQVAAEAGDLRRENSHLRSVNVELNKQLRLLTQSTLRNHNRSPGSRSYTTGSTRFGDRQEGSHGHERESQIGTGVNGIRAENSAELLDMYSRLPKSISVKCDDYLELEAHGAIVNNGGRSRDSTRFRSSSLQNVKQKMYVGGEGKKGTYHHGHEDPVELEVYKQGTFKTELCNKWQETGECPYGDHCQFAHGIDELRPVIRHPRYKTQVCRMVLNGVVCPYGHRCHFLHALSDHKAK